MKLTTHDKAWAAFILDGDLVSNLVTITLHIGGKYYFDKDVSSPKEFSQASKEMPCELARYYLADTEYEAQVKLIERIKFRASKAQAMIERCDRELGIVEATQFYENRG